MSKEKDRTMREILHSVASEVEISQKCFYFETAILAMKLYADQESLTEIPTYGRNWLS